MTWRRNFTVKSNRVNICVISRLFVNKLGEFPSRDFKYIMDNLKTRLLRIHAKLTLRNNCSLFVELDSRIQFLKSYRAVFLYCFSKTSKIYLSSRLVSTYTRTPRFASRRDTEPIRSGHAFCVFLNMKPGI